METRMRKTGWGRGPRERRGAAVLAVLAAVALAAAFTDPAAAVDRGREAAAQDSAEILLRRMSGRLAASPGLTVDAVRQVDAALLEGRAVPESASIHLELRRPDRLYVLSTGTDLERHLYFDGQNVTVYDAVRKLYAIEPVQGTIDDLIRTLDERYGFVPPLAEFLANDPWTFIEPQVATARLTGTQVINGRQCRQLAVTGEVANATIWLTPRTDLPCGLIATFTQVEGNPRVRAGFSNWNLRAEPDDSRFRFTPPPGARRIPMPPVPETEG
ncbi:MAG TPA: DUF2092 domain-containing protein [Longimicrobium sp.]|nr:DUF2092 domain-containing protein [Longimicrobium sp.]